MRILNKVIIVLIFLLAGVLFFHSFTSINVDIGRHIKLGEIIWQTGAVPKVNLLSFTAPEYPFINHHWLSEVVFYKVYSLGQDWITGLQATMILKIIILLTTYFLFFLTVKKHNIFSIVFAFVLSILVFSARTEARPEIFSYLFFAIYLFIIYKIRDNQNSKFKILNSKFQLNWLWFLPVVQLFWVNTHIYFAIGPILFLSFLIDKKINSKSETLNPKQYQNPKNQTSKRFKFFGFRICNLFRIFSLEFRVFISIILVNLINPNFYQGAIYPLRVLNSYGYSVAENSSLFFLARYFGSWAPQDKLFLVSLFVLTVSFVLSFWRTKLTMSNIVMVNDVRHPNWLKIRIFDLLLITMTTVLSFKMQRNIPLFALSLWPIMSENLDSVFETNYFKKISNFFYIIVVFILVISIYFVTSGKLYNWFDSAKMFGLNVSSSAQDGTDFIKINNIKGPVFNNFDIGSYLVWQLYPDQKVFIDGRPEAYPVEFFENIYKPMQRDQKVWREMSEKYGINYIFFSHTDMTEWGEEFLTRISKDKEWPMVFLNDSVVVFLKNTDSNQHVVDKYKITEDNIGEKIPQILNKLNKNDDNSFVNFGNALYRFRWFTGSVMIFEALVKNQPDNPYGYQGAGYAYVAMNNSAVQQKAADNLKKAIDLGFKTFNNYFTLGIANANLGNFFAAEENLKKALEIKPNNQNAKQVLETIRKKMYLQ